MRMFIISDIVVYALQVIIYASVSTKIHTFIVVRVADKGQPLRVLNTVKSYREGRTNS